MKFLMCIKPVSSKLIANEFNDDSLAINPYDLKALNDLIRLKKNNNIQIDVVCMGSEKCQNLLRRCLAMGSDNAYLISDSHFAGSDTYSTTYILSNAINYLNAYDFIVCGNQSIDGETGQVPYGLSERLNIDTIDSIEKICEIEDNELIISQKTESEKLYLKISRKKILIYDDFELNLPYISLFKLKKVSNMEIPILFTDVLNLDVNECGTIGSKTKVISTTSNIKAKTRQEFAADIEDGVNMVLSVLKK